MARIKLPSSKDAFAIEAGPRSARRPKPKSRHAKRLERMVEVQTGIDMATELMTGKLLGGVIGGIEKLDRYVKEGDRREELERRIAEAAKARVDGAAAPAGSEKDAEVVEVGTTDLTPGAGVTSAEETVVSLSPEAAAPAESLQIAPEYDPRVGPVTGLTPVVQTAAERAAAALPATPPALGSDLAGAPDPGALPALPEAPKPAEALALDPDQDGLAPGKISPKALRAIRRLSREADQQIAEEDARREEAARKLKPLRDEMDAIQQELVETITREKRMWEEGIDQSPEQRTRLVRLSGLLKHIQNPANQRAILSKELRGNPQLKQMRDLLGPVSKEKQVAILDSGEPEPRDAGRQEAYDTVDARVDIIGEALAEAGLGTSPRPAAVVSAAPELGSMGEGEGVSIQERVRRSLLPSPEGHGGPSVAGMARPAAARSEDVEEEIVRISAPTWDEEVAEEAPATAAEEPKQGVGPAVLKTVRKGGATRDVERLEEGGYFETAQVEDPNPYGVSKVTRREDDYVVEYKDGTRRVGDVNAAGDFDGEVVTVPKKTPSRAYGTGLPRTSYYKDGKEVLSAYELEQAKTAGQSPEEYLAAKRAQAVEEEAARAVAETEAAGEAAVGAPFEQTPVKVVEQDVRDEIFAMSGAPEQSRAPGAQLNVGGTEQDAKAAGKKSVPASRVRNITKEQADELEEAGVALTRSEQTEDLGYDDVYDKRLRVFAQTMFKDAKESEYTPLPAKLPKSLAGIKHLIKNGNWRPEDIDILYEAAKYSPEAPVAGSLFEWLTGGHMKTFSTSVTQGAKGAKKVKSWQDYYAILKKARDADRKFEADLAKTGAETEKASAQARKADAEADAKRRKSRGGRGGGSGANRRGLVSRLGTMAGGIGKRGLSDSQYANYLAYATAQGARENALKTGGQILSALTTAQKSFKGDGVVTYAELVQSAPGIARLLPEKYTALDVDTAIATVDRTLKANKEAQADFKRLSGIRDEHGLSGEAKKAERILRTLKGKLQGRQGTVTQRTALARALDEANAAYLAEDWAAFNKALAAIDLK